MTLSESQRRLVRALAKTMFTREREPALDGDDVGVVDRMDAWMGMLGTLQRTQILAAFTAFDRAFGIWLGAPSKGFADGTFAERTAFLQASVETQDFNRRQVMELIRIVLLTSYIDSPEISAAIGMEDQVSIARARVAAAKAAESAEPEVIG